MTDMETTAYFAAPAIIICFGLILVLISQITAPDPYTPPNPPRHAATTDVDVTTIEIIEGIIDVDDLESFPQVGRRGLHSAARSMRVADDWKPYIGDLRVTILMQKTAEFLFVRKPIDQLTDPYQRAQWATELATVS